MIRTFTCILLLFVCSNSFAQKYKVDTLYKSGPIENRINIVILGDGFTDPELPKFHEEARKFADFFLSYNPYSHYRAYFNFFDIRTPSKQSGVTNPGNAPDAYADQPVGNKDTFFGSSFGTSIHRLVTISNYDALTSVLANNFPAYDLVVVLVNTPWYGGSGGGIAVHTLHEQANAIGVHEIGHTFTHLNDEYWAGPSYGYEAANMTANRDPETIRWKNWLNTPPVGIYQHGSAEAANWFKPTNVNCLMEVLHKEFCNVCREATTEKILSIVDPVERIQPDTTGITSIYEGMNGFELSLLHPEPNSLQVEWRLDGTMIANGTDQLQLADSKLLSATGKLTATIFDSTFLSRVDTVRQTRTRVLTWDLKKSSGAPVFKITVSSDSICLGQTASLMASGCNGNVRWSTGEQTQVIQVQPGKTMDYVATCQVNNHEIKATSTVTVVPLPVASATNSGPYFTGAAIQLSADGGITYQWSGPAQFTSKAQNPSIASAALVNSGMYKVVVSGPKGCIAEAQTEVKVDPILAVDPTRELFVVSPNPAKDNINIETGLPGESVFTLYDLTGKIILHQSFQMKASLSVSQFNAGMYLYRIVNGMQEFSDKLIIQ